MRAPTPVEGTAEWQTLLSDPTFVASLLGSEVGLSAKLASSVAVLLQQWIKSHAPTNQIEEITLLATTVLGDKDKAQKWLSEPNVAMDNRPPIELIGEKDGFERVKNLLLRVEYGVLA